MCGNEVGSGAVGVDRPTYDARFFVHQLAVQFEATFDMLKDAVEKCPTVLWDDAHAKPAFWHEAYHTIFWCDNFVGDKNKEFERCPLGVDIDPRLFSNPPKRPAKNEVLSLLRSGKNHVAGRLGAMTDDDLKRPDAFGKESDVRQFDFVLHRILYALRHGQHHVGKLAARLRAEGVGLGAWLG